MRCYTTNSCDERFSQQDNPALSAYSRYPYRTYINRNTHSNERYSSRLLLNISSLLEEVPIVDALKDELRGWLIPFRHFLSITATVAEACWQSPHALISVSTDNAVQLYNSMARSWYRRRNDCIMHCPSGVRNLSCSKIPNEGIPATPCLTLPAQHGRVSRAIACRLYIYIYSCVSCLPSTQCDARDVV